MQISIREKRKLYFSHKIITPDTIRRLASIFAAEAEQVSDASAILLNFSADAADNSSYESSSQDIFAEGQLIGRKIITRINMRFQTFENDKNMELQLLHTQDDASPENYILVSGNNPTWVNGLIARLNEVLESCEHQPQSRKIMRYAGWFAFVLFIVLYFRLFYDQLNRAKSGLVQLLGLVGVPLGFVLLLNALGNYLSAVWPSVELQTAPGYQQKPLQKRKILALTFTIIFIPLALAFIYDLLKNLLHLF